MPATKPRKTLRSLVKSWLPRSLRAGLAHVGVVRLQGVIGKVGPLSQGMTLDSVAPLLQRAFSDEDAIAVAVIVNSPGGSPVQSHLIFRRIRALAAEYGKPVLGFVEDAAASGGYMIACAADEIHADPSSIVGSIGVVSGGFGFVEAIQRLGIERRLHTAGDSKAMLDPFLPEKPEEIERLKELQADIHAHFIALVRGSRGARLKDDSENLFTGAFWTGTRALEYGLIDGIGDLSSVLRARYGEKVKLRVIAPRRGFGLSRFFGMQAAALPEALASSIEDRALWSRYGL